MLWENSHYHDAQAAASEDYRDDFVNAGAIAVPLRVFDEAGTCVRITVTPKPYSPP